MKCALVVLALCSVAYARFDTPIYREPVQGKYVHNQGPTEDVPLEKLFNWIQSGVEKRQWPVKTEHSTEKYHELVDREQQVQQHVGLDQDYWTPYTHQPYQGYPVHQNYYQGYPLFQNYHQGYPFYQNYREGYPVYHSYQQGYPFYQNWQQKYPSVYQTYYQGQYEYPVKSNLYNKYLSRLPQWEQYH